MPYDYLRFMQFNFLLLTNIFLFFSSFLVALQLWKVSCVLKDTAVFSAICQFSLNSVVLQINDNIFGKRSGRMNWIRDARIPFLTSRGSRIDPSIQLKEGSALDYLVQPTTTSCRTRRPGLDEERSFDIGPRPNSWTIINTLLFSAGYVSIFMAAAHTG